MDFNNSEAHKVFSSGITIPVKSGHESEDIVIDLELSTTNVQPESDQATKQSERISRNISNQWSKERALLGEGKSIDGWFSPKVGMIEQQHDDYQDQIHTTPTIKQESEINDLLIETLSSFNENANAFKEHLGTLRTEVQNLPLFQGALKSLNTSIIGQRDDLKELKSVTDLGMTNIIDAQKEVRDSLVKLIDSVEIFGKSQFASQEVKVDSTKDIWNGLKNIIASQIESLNRIESNIKTIDLNRFHGNLETIYQAVKKSYDESRDQLESISETTKLIYEKPFNTSELAKDESLNDIREELSLHLDALLRVEKKFESLKTKATTAFLITMSVMGVILAASLNVF